MADTKVDEAQPATVVAVTGVAHPTLPRAIARMRTRTWRRIRLTSVAVIVSILGLDGIPWRSAFADFVSRHAWAWPLIILAGCAVGSLLALPWVVTGIGRIGRFGAAFAAADRVRVVVVLLVALSSVSAAVVTSTIAAATRPAWCPAFICPPPPLPTGTDPHDDNLEVGFVGFQAQGFAIAGGVGSVDLGNLPSAGDQRSVVAQRTGPGSPYSVALKVRDIASSPDPLVIEGVVLHVDRAAGAPSPLAVLVGVQQLQYGRNPVDVAYSGQSTGRAVASTPKVGRATAPLELARGETDELDVRVVSSVPADLTFRVSVLYQVGDGSTQEFLYPADLRVMFADTWARFTIQDGQVVPADSDGGALG